MREIKFRAWSDKLNKYISNWGVFDDPDTHAFQSGPPSGAGEPYVHEQYTGLKDKNGKEVWEGDIVSRNVPQARAGAIQFAQGIFGINWDYGQNPNPLWLEGTMYGSWNGKHNLRPIDDNFMTENMEVIGNIHENPELL